MNLSQLAILILIGVLFWAANNYVPMGKRARQVLTIIAVIAFVMWLGSLFGISVSVGAFASAIK